MRRRGGGAASHLCRVVFNNVGAVRDPQALAAHGPAVISPKTTGRKQTAANKKDRQPHNHRPLAQESIQGQVIARSGKMSKVNASLF